MNNENSSSGCSRFFGSAFVIGVITVLGLIWAMFTFYENNRDTKKQLDNQAIQIAQQQTQIGLIAEQNQLQSQQLTLVVQQSGIEGHFLTPLPTDDEGFPLTATAYYHQVKQIEATNQAIETRQKSIEATQTAISIPQSTPSIVIMAEDVIPKIKGENNELQNTLNWWREYDPTGIGGEFTPTSIAGKKCFGLVWNTNQYGYHRLVVFQKSLSITFADGGWGATVCVPDYIIISAEDIGRIQADWLGKRYGDIQSHPWQVIVDQ